MPVFKSPKRKIFRKQQDVDALISDAKWLVSLIEHDPQTDGWFNGSGVAFKKSSGWGRFKQSLEKLTIIPLLLFLLVGCRATPIVPAPAVKAMTPPLSATKSLEPKLVKFTWRHPHPETITHYKLYYGPAPRTYTNFVVAYTTNTTFMADRNVLHYFAVTANIGDALEADYSNEVGYPDWMVPRTNVVIITMWSTNGETWTDLKRETNAVNGSMGLWKLRIE